MGVVEAGEERSDSNCGARAQQEFSGTAKGGRKFAGAEYLSGRTKKPHTVVCGFYLFTMHSFLKPNFLQNADALLDNLSL